MGLGGKRKKPTRVFCGTIALLLMKQRKIVMLQQFYRTLTRPLLETENFFTLRSA
jgi:hypothetical protein